MPDRRVRRSKKMHEAMTRFLEGLLAARGVEALALASEAGFIAGAGEGDLEWMGLMGASRRLRELHWDDRKLHVHPFEINAETLYLVAMGSRAVSDDSAMQGIRRILE